MKVWVLTSEYNEYDQHGEYFLAVFKNKPSRERLSDIVRDDEVVDHLLNKGGGRIEWEDKWYNLKVEDAL